MVFLMLKQEKGSSFSSYSKVDQLKGMTIITLTINTLNNKEYACDSFFEQLDRIIMNLQIITSNHFLFFLIRLQIYLLLLRN